jgi:sterol desaturase/sphingolipid hydroxylase (fatty acid hydroxylase superfamily)
VLYTLIHRLGAFRLALFFALDPLFDVAREAAHAAGVSGVQLDSLWPGVTSIAAVAFVLYLIVLDFAQYWLHRAQHHFNAWWALHSLHHAQRQMTLWSDNRNHLLDDLVIDVAMVVVAAAIGVPPEQFVLLVAFSRLLESLQHTNVRMSFGSVGERLLVSPRFHRYHHSIGAGHESAGKGTLGGHNFGVLFPWWDVLFGTADFANTYDSTGVRDQLPNEGARNYGHGFWQQQWLGLKRLAGKA